MGIQEYWIVDYRALGGKRFIGDPKRPMVTVNSLVERRYQPQQFEEGSQLESRVFPELKVEVEELLAIRD